MKEISAGAGGYQIMQQQQQQPNPNTAGGGGTRIGVSTRSAMEKEKTKMRERHRRSITTKIFNGLRKHGGYTLSPRADINEVLRHLASEAGWIVDPDGTTYRSTSTSLSNAYNVCAVCGAGIKSRTPTPTSSFIGGAGESSRTTSPRPVTVGDSMIAYAGGPSPSPSPSPSLYYSRGGSVIASGCGVSSSLCDLTDNPRGMYTFGRRSAGVFQSSATASGSGGGGPSSAVTVAAYEQPQHLYLQEARASNQNTPVASPQRRV